MTTLYLRIPPHAAGDAAQVPFALVGDGGNLMQQGAGAVRALGDLVANCRRVVLLLAASDVTLVQAQVPPLSSARLKAALPGLVEDQILSDPADCVLVAAPAAGPDGRRTIAVAQRARLEALVGPLLELGARTVAAVPLQLCLPLQPGSVAAHVGADELALRTGQYEGVGIAMAAAPAVALQTARALAGTAPLNVLAPAALQAELQAAAGAMELPVTVEPEQWEHLIAGSKSTTLDLVPALGAAGARQHDWQRWRWPLRIALAVVVVNIGALNIEWLRLKREADAVRQSMTQTFKTVYPGQAILDPLAQMRRNIALARANSGQLSPDEFTFLAASLGEALAAAPRPVELATLEYRDGAVKARVKSGADAALLQQLQATLAGRGLRLTDSGGVWELRSAGGAK